MSPRFDKPDGMRQEVYEGIVVAQTLREELGIDDLAPVDCVLELAERALALEVVLAPLHDGISGFYLPVTPTPLVLIQQSHPVQRQRFTLAHEVGHHTLRHAAAPRIHGADASTGAAIGAGAAVSTGAATDPGADGAADAVVDPGPAVDPGAEALALNADYYRPRRAPSAEERAANAFAAELLVPYAGARRVAARSAGAPPLDRAVRLSAHFGVSAFAALVKLEVIAAIDKPTANAVRDQLKVGAHLPRYDALGLTALDDALQRHADAGGGPRYSATARHTLAQLRAEVDAFV